MERKRIIRSWRWSKYGAVVENISDALNFAESAKFGRNKFIYEYLLYVELCYT